MADTLGVGIVGAGAIGPVHARAISELSDARLVAVVDPREDAARHLASKHGAAWHSDLADLLARPDIDVVILATPSGLHADQAVLAAQAGKHVITEKPMAISLDGADRMIAACRDAGVTLSVMFQNRFSRDAVLLKRAVDAGLLGRPVLGSAVLHWHRLQTYYDEHGGWRGTWALDGGGALMNQTIHTIDLLQWTLGPVARAMAFIATLERDIEAEDTANATLQFSNGALGTIQGTTLADQNWPVRLEIVGTKSRALLEDGRLIGWRPDPRTTDSLLTARDLELTAGSNPDEAFGAAHGRQLGAIFAALLAGKEPPVAGIEARKAIEIILAIYQSARTGDSIAFPNAPDPRR